MSGGPSELAGEAPGSGTPHGGGTTWEGRAPAKVNLTLRVLARESGGYHQIETIFQALELADLVRIDLTDRTGIELEVQGVPPGALGSADQNLAVQAARHYRRALGGGRPDAPHEKGVRIELTKRIPHGAGLGGGSSDAASVLLGLDRLHGEPLGRSRLVALAAELGADVAFFVLNTPRALAWGRGDRLLPLAPLPRRPVLLAIPPDPVATPWAYGLLAEHREREGAHVAGGTVLDPLDLDGWAGMTAMAHNAFQEILEPLRPELGRLRRALEEAGAEPALLSGSGSAVFGVFRREDDAGRAREAIEGMLPGLRVIRTFTRGASEDGSCTASTAS